MKKLVAYVSVTGETAALAKTLAEALDADLAQLEPSGCPWEALEGYGQICLGFPVHGDSVPGIIRTFLRSGPAKGKTILPFSPDTVCDMEQICADLRRCCPQAHVLPGTVLAADAGQAERAAWTARIRHICPPGQNRTR